MPEVLLSGDHARIRQWRRLESLKATRRFRPDLFEKAVLTPKEQKALRESDLAEAQTREAAPQQPTEPDCGP